MRPAPQHLVWTDLETVGQPDPNNLILEVGIVVTDLDLRPLAEYSEVVQYSSPSRIEAMVALNPAVMKMHTDNGLLAAVYAAADSVSGRTMSEVDAEVHTMLSDIGDERHSRRFRIAGSGVAHFDHPLIKVQMPRFAALLHYAPADIGQYRRLLQLFGAGEWVPDVPASWDASGPGKAHRALADARAHLLEAQLSRQKIREVKAVYDAHVVGELVDRAPRP